MELAGLYDANQSVDVLLCALSPGENPPPDVNERMHKGEAAALLAMVAGSMRSSLLIAKNLGRFRSLLARAEDPTRAAPALCFASREEALEAAQRLDDGEVLDPSVALETAADQTAGWLTLACASDGPTNQALWREVDTYAHARGCRPSALLCIISLRYIDTNGAQDTLLSMMWG